MSSQQIEEAQIAEVAGFIAKTFEILNNKEFSKIVYWAPNGNEFMIKDAAKFQQLVLPKYFRHNKMNSFIRQLNMYGFHKSRADHTKSVFSHPSFLKARADLLITIKRKIKAKFEHKLDSPAETPIKQRPNLEVNTANTKQIVQTSNGLEPMRQFGNSSDNLSFNFLGTKERFNSIMNLSFSVNILPQPDQPEMNLADGLQELDDQASIADDIELKSERQQQKAVAGPSYKFVNPSCFFESMHKGMN